MDVCSCLRWVQAICAAALVFSSKYIYTNHFLRLLLRLRKIFFRNMFLVWCFFVCLWSAFPADWLLFIGGSAAGTACCCLQSEQNCCEMKSDVGCSGCGTHSDPWLWPGERFKSERVLTRGLDHLLEEDVEVAAPTCDFSWFIDAICSVGGWPPWASGGGNSPLAVACSCRPWCSSGITMTVLFTRSACTNDRSSMSFDKIKCGTERSRMQRLEEVRPQNVPSTKDRKCLTVSAGWNWTVVVWRSLQRTLIATDVGGLLPVDQSPFCCTSHRSSSWPWNLGSSTSRSCVAVHSVSSIRALSSPCGDVLLLLLVGGLVLKLFRLLDNPWWSSAIKSKSITTNYALDILAPRVFASTLSNSKEEFCLAGKDVCTNHWRAAQKSFWVILRPARQRSGSKPSRSVSIAALERLMQTISRRIVRGSASAVIRVREWKKASQGLWIQLLPKTKTAWKDKIANVRLLC